MDGEERNRDPSARRGRERRDNFIEDSLDPPPPPRTRCNYSSITQSRPPRVPYNQITGRDSDIKLSSIDSDPKKRCVSLLRAATLDWTKPTRERKEGREGESLMERRGLSGRCVTRAEIVQTYPSKDGEDWKKGEKKKGKRKRDDDIVCYPAVEKGWWKIGVVDEAWRDNDDSAFVTKVEEAGGERGDLRIVGKRCFER